MGQKVHPTGFRLGYTKTWDSRWFAEGQDYGKLLFEDIELRKDLKKRLGHAGIAKIEIERAANKLKVTIHASRPGIVIGRKGSEVEKLREEARRYLVTWISPSKRRQDYKDDIVALLQDPDPEVQTAALQSLQFVSIHWILACFLVFFLEIRFRLSGTAKDEL